MKILVIGNGFDLAHGLPTKYNHFLEFLTLIEKMSTYPNKPLNFLNVLKESSVDHYIQKYIEDLLSKITDEYKINNFDGKFFEFQDLDVLVKKSKDELLQELITHLEKNLWYEHFMKAKSYINEGWIDFESEISRVIQVLDQCKTKELFDIRDVVDEDIGKILSSVSIQEDSGKFKVDEKKLQKLEEDLNKLIRSLEIFLEECVGKINIERILPDIHGIRFNKVLSFNYTNTYKKIYEPFLMQQTYAPSQFEYDFIHGKANIENDIDTNNMVLGIDEYLDYTEMSKNTTFISFKKYFQRIHKETGCEYKNWLGERNQSNELVIFGHSLDITDKDILRELILTDKMKTTIFYYNKKVYASQIANLVKVLGKDELIKRVYGSKKSIIFKQQQDPTKITEPSQISEVVVSEK
ncbi:AbiH family protein [Paenibacillus sp. OAS669]|uniref:AbiH family protein n=1 Tax=Paenibacillus sp. OAS669 TaxID=2663821 RepID=UPI00178C0466|nr:AbiH family protein [Paenibacillus sp. OAS669]MBE1446088.1 hypothetical protein [Paenibacillus sp. OAS669]